MKKIQKYFYIFSFILLKYFADSGIIETLTVKQIKKHRIGAHFFKLNTDKPYFNLLCCFE
ncbi:hypothetical protein D3845_01700 [Streptococcus mutans]|nr:hypothetical protein [Streptococcus mutans]